MVEKEGGENYGKKKQGVNEPKKQANIVTQSQINGKKSYHRLRHVEKTLNFPEISVLLLITLKKE